MQTYANAKLVIITGSNFTTLQKNGGRYGMLRLLLNVKLHYLDVKLQATYEQRCVVVTPE